MRKKEAVKGVIFLSIGAAIFVLLCGVFQPVWFEVSNYNRAKGFYAQPRNSIEVIFLGTSHTVDGFIPMELYKEYGISAYNLGSEVQPMLASYYWLEEAYRLNKETLKVVVMDVSNMRYALRDVNFHKSIDEMKFSEVKYRVIRDYTSDTNDAVNSLISLLNYHDRWKSLDKTDFQKNNVDQYLQGYNFIIENYSGKVAYNQAGILETFYDDSVNEAQLVEESVSYMKKAITFCQEHDLKIVLCKTPTAIGWNSSLHKTVEQFAQGYGIEFYDFNFLPLSEDCSYNFYVDSIEGDHLNYYGAKKLTDWFGNYLVENTNVSNVTGQKEYEFLIPLLDQYERKVEWSAELEAADDVASYLKCAVEKDDTAVFIAVKDEGAGALTDECRAVFNELGLKKLSELGYRDSYIAIIKDGAVITEESDSPGEDAAKEPLLITGKIDDVNYRIVSGGYLNGNTSSCMINGIGYSPNQRGLNIIVYDCRNNQVVQSIAFDTCSSVFKVSAKQMAESKEQRRLYDQRMENLRRNHAVSEEIQEADFLQYLDIFSDENYYIFISIKDEAAAMFTPENRSQFMEKGLSELAGLQYRDSYIGILCGETVVHEEKDHGEGPIELKGINYKIISAGWESGNTSSILIDNTEYSLNRRGLNVAIYDRSLKTVISQKCFDTCAVSPSLFTAGAGSAEGGED